jgi:hypothetical protein
MSAIGNGCAIGASLIAGICLTTGKPPPQGPDRYVYCAVQGNTWADGTAIAPGTALNLLAGQPTSDPLYLGATIGFWVPGLGATCQLTPAQSSLAQATTERVNHVGGRNDSNQPNVYPLVAP